MLTRELVRLARHDLGSLDGTHLGDPTRRGLHLSDGAKLIRRVSRDANVVRALQNQLDITDLEYLGAALFRVATSGVEDIINKRVCKI